MKIKILIIWLAINQNLEYFFLNTVLSPFELCPLSIACKLHEKYIFLNFQYLKWNFFQYDLQNFQFIKIFNDQNLKRKKLSNMQRKKQSEFPIFQREINHLKPFMGR